MLRPPTPKPEKKRKKTGMHYCRRLRISIKFLGPHALRATSARANQSARGKALATPRLGLAYDGAPRQRQEFEVK